MYKPKHIMRGSLSLMALHIMAGARTGDNVPVSVTHDTYLHNTALP